MRSSLVTALLAAAAASAAGCALDATNVSTRLVKVCTHDVPLAFQKASPTDTVATLPVDNIGSDYDAPDAQVALRSLTLTRTGGGGADFGFADSLTVSVTSPGSGLPDADIAVLAPVPATSPLFATGDRSINLAPYLTADALLNVRLDLHGPQVPDQAVTVTLDACLDVDGVVIRE